MGGLIDMEWKGCELDMRLDLNFDLNHDLTLKFGFSTFQGQILKQLYSKNGWTECNETKGIWIYRMVDNLCDLTHDLDLGFSRLNFGK